MELLRSGSGKRDYSLSPRSEFSHRTGLVTVRVGCYKVSPPLIFCFFYLYPCLSAFHLAGKHHRGSAESDDQHDSLTKSTVDAGCCLGAHGTIYQSDCLRPLHMAEAFHRGFPEQALKRPG